MLDDYSRKVVWHKIEDKKGWIMEINSIYLTLKKDSIFNDIQATLQGVTFTYERKFIIIYLCYVGTIFHLRKMDQTTSKSISEVFQIKKWK